MEHILEPAFLMFSLSITLMQLLFHPRFTYMSLKFSVSTFMESAEVSFMNLQRVALSILKILYSKWRRRSSSNNLRSWTLDLRQLPISHLQQALLLKKTKKLFKARSPSNNKKRKREGEKCPIRPKMLSSPKEDSYYLLRLCRRSSWQLSLAKMKRPPWLLRRGQPERGKERRKTRRARTIKRMLKNDEKKFVL